MRVDKNTENEIEITLSKRNLEALLEKLTWDSARTITIEASNGITLIVHSEHNAIHYPNREPGQMVNGNNERY